MKVSIERMEKSDKEIAYRVSVDIINPNSQIILPTHEIAFEVLQLVSRIGEAYERKITFLERDRERAYKARNEEIQKNKTA